MKTKVKLELLGGQKLEFDVKGAGPDEVADMFADCSTLVGGSFKSDPPPKYGLHLTWLQRADRDMFSGHKKGDIMRGKFGTLKCTAE